MRRGRGGREAVVFPREYTGVCLLRHSRYPQNSSLRFGKAEQAAGGEGRGGLLGGNVCLRASDTV